MDDFLERAWRAGARPFDGLTLTPENDMPLEELARWLSLVVEFLHAEFPSAIPCRHADWHQHDGWVSSSEPCTWAEVLAIVKSPGSLLANQPGDDHVRLGISESSGSFYLRIWVPEAEDEAGALRLGGSFDVSASPHLMERLSVLLGPARMITSDAKLFFDGRSAR